MAELENTKKNYNRIPFTFSYATAFKIEIEKFSAFLIEIYVIE